MIVTPQAKLDAMPYDQRAAVLNDDERAVFASRSSARSLLVLVSIGKRYLAEPDTPPSIALRCLRCFDKFTSGDNPTCSPAALAKIAPACDAAHELYNEIRKLVRPHADGADPGERWHAHEPVFKAIEQWDTFAAFANLNPSLLAALRCRGGTC